MSQQPSDTLVDKNNHQEKNNIPEQQKLFYPCVYTTQYANESPASGTLIDEKLKSFDADFIRLGDELRRERKVKVLQRYIQYSSEDKKRLKLLQRFTIVSKLRGMPRLPKKRTGRSLECRDSAGLSSGFPESHGLSVIHE
ncbi:hypothetical protein AFCA_003340 [Aspergillus flavus]|uniref:Unnamed protein product n=2 Tax=Aspergillus oryzae TaxID=5062 RepID=A0AAN5BQY7_ASPOZ|nr:hypothetical protein AFCA_003340 [Aspergillus flavus]GMG01104.1 unnamed protein product [Aspergillus oryzae]GMG22778.1 unnamed protein product [Aspergillus oryzae]GMG44824.1 unnamed protein product [Aspergillus oryzae var. brunneus]